VSRAVRESRVDPTLFVQVLVLMIGVLAAAQLVSLFTVFSLPPPAPEVHVVSEIGRAYLHKPLTTDKPLILERAAKPPKSTQPVGSLFAYRTRQSIAEYINARSNEQLTADDIVIASSGARWFNDRTSVRLTRDQIATTQNNERFLVAPFRVAFHQMDGSWRIVRASPGLRLDPWQQRTLIWFAMTSLAVIAAAWLLTRRLASPFAKLAEGAERLGRDPGAPPLALKGSSEIQTAVQAFNNMQQRLRRYVEDRTAMIGAIAHDLRTPLTRMRFRIESMPDADRAKMASDLDQMEAMLSATMAFVRDATYETQRTPLELSSLLQSLADEMEETRADVTVIQAEKVVVDGDPIALKRLFTNLLDNAVKFGKRARVKVYADGEHAVVEVEDDGPGVRESEAERVFEPFYRAEPSRSRETGGIGLGLAVVRTIARAHGGDAKLENRKGGGLTARVTLPI